MSTTAAKPLGMYTYAWDFVDEGVDNVLDAIAEQAGLNTVYVATWYHSGMFFLPHNPNRKVIFPEPGALYFQPGEWHSRSTLRPTVSKLTGDWAGFWEELRRGCDERNLQLSAWMPVLHNTGMASKHPEYAVTNAWGDSIIHSLCASHEEVKDLVSNVVGDVAAMGIFDRILLESIEYLPLQHGFHHEVIGVSLEPETAFATSLCFCTGCSSRAAEQGIDASALRETVRTLVTGALGDGESDIPATLEAFRELHDGAMGRYLDLRSEALTKIVRACRERMPDDRAPKLAILDFGPLYPLGQYDHVWQSGVDLKSQLSLVDEVHPTFYFDDINVLTRKVEEYLAALPDRGTDMIPAFRAIQPQVDSSRALQEQVGALAAYAYGYSFYNYSFMRLETLSWIRSVVQRTEA